MLKLFPVLILIAILNACNPSKQMNSLSNKEQNDGWQLLFDGKSTNGWHNYGGGSMEPFWQVVDGTLYLDPTGKKEDIDIATDDEFENFHLKLEWKISEKGNSGIVFYVHENPKYKWPWETGPEMQVLDNNGHPDAKIYKHRAGDLYDLIACSKETVKAAGEWNEVEIKCLDGKLDFYLNGVNVVSTTLWDDNWKAMVANSKFKSMPDFSTYKKGRIALQDHGDKVWYRNIRIKRF
jgi:hypothetical protein